MALIKLYKDPRSVGNACPSVYLDENGELIVQGQLIEDDTLTELDDVLPGEGAVRVPADVVLGALVHYQDLVGT